MAWEKVSEELSGLLENKLFNYNCEKKKMFGCPVWFVQNNMFAGVFGQSVFIRLSQNDRETIFYEFDEASPFEPMKGRVMKEYISLPDSVVGDGAILDKWLERGYGFVSSLPHKPGK
jgi:TfoX/Sxy family transcriptional regulator of competence genes